MVLLGTLKYISAIVTNACQKFLVLIWAHPHHFQPVDLLPFRIEDARRQLESNGDFSLEGLQVLRDAEDERRGK